MNSPNPEFILRPAFINEARTLARQTGRSFIEVLEEKCNLPPELFVTEIAQAWRYKAVSMAE